MPLISPIGRKAAGTRLLVGSLYFLLTAGALTMLFPLLLMISGSVKGTFDSTDVDLIPRYLIHDSVFFQRYLESKYGDLTSLNRVWDTDYANWTEIQPPAAISEKQLHDFDEFRRLAKTRADWWVLGHQQNAGRNFRLFTGELIARSNGGLDRLNQILGVKFTSWSDVRPQSIFPQRLPATHDPLGEATREFQRSVPVEDKILAGVEGHWKSASLLPRYRHSLADYEAKTGLKFASWSDVRLAEKFPSAASPAEKADWEAYVRERAPFQFLRVDPSETEPYRQFLASLYGNNISMLNKAYGTSYAAFSQIGLPDAATLSGVPFNDFNQFIRKHASIDNLSLQGPDFDYRQFLRQRFHDDIAAARAAYHVSWRDFSDAQLPVAAVDWSDVQRHKSAWRWDFLTRNYSYVLDFVMRHGRGVQNTIILCVLTILAHLIINPLAAYGLSRFGLPSTYKILLFLMATVAFPAEVMMIPSFLQLKEFGLLNSFSALILPGLANGYSIFLLKGFFDSLPRELYESATIDGASEPRIFFTITLALSKPILAVLALGSFTGAFSAFFFAIVLCPDQKMWTLMVWLYQLQQTSGSQSINYAALCLASIPTLLVFVFCQNIIMRGIVVPVDK